MDDEDVLALEGQLLALEEAIQHHLDTCHPTEDGLQDQRCEACERLSEREEAFIGELGRMRRLKEV